MDAKRHLCAAVWPLLLLAMWIGVSRAHVALTFPPARQPAWDFLDSGRTPPPCGVPKGSLKTSILSGSTFNVTWHLGYPHRGGYRIQVLDASEKPILDLTDGGQQNNSSVFVEGDPTALSYLVHLPKDLECRDCTIRLIRQASEWGKNYMFWSCADVDIIPRPEYRETCSGHGKDIAGRCRCNPLYSGHRCQYRDECSEDKDCGRHGKCINLEATTYPKRQCFCEMGWFGPQCNKQSPVKDPSIINFADYRKEVMSDAFEFYWRVLRNSQELEAVMVVKGGTGYAAVGWRPLALTAACKGFPFLEELATEAANETVRHQHHPASLSLPLNAIPASESAVPEPEPEIAAEPEPVAQPEPVAEPEPEAEPVAEPVPEPLPEPTTSSPSANQSDHHDHGEHDHHHTELPTAKHLTSINMNREDLTESPTEIRQTVPTTRKPRPKLPVLGRSPLAPKTSPTTTTTTTTTEVAATSTTDASVEGEVREEASIPATTGPPTTTKKLSPLDRLIAKNKLNSRNTQTTEKPVEVEAFQAKGSVTRIQLSDLPEAGISTGVTGKRSARSAVEQEIISSLSDSTRREKQMPFGPVAFPGPRLNTFNSPTSSLAVLPATPRLPKPKPGFSPVSGSDGWIPMSPKNSVPSPTPVIGSIAPVKVSVIDPAVPIVDNSNDRMDNFAEEIPVLFTVPSSRIPVTVSPTKISVTPKSNLKEETTEAKLTSTNKPSQADLQPTSSVKPTTEFVPQPLPADVVVGTKLKAVDPEPQPEPEANEAALELEPQPEPEPKPEPKPEIKEEPKQKPKEEPQPEPEPEPEPAPEPAAESALEPIAEPAPEPVAEPAPKLVAEPDPVAEPAPEPTPEFKAEMSESAPEPVAEPDAEPEPEPKSETVESADKAHGGHDHHHHHVHDHSSHASEPTDYKPAHKYAPRADFHPMDCTDIVIGMARGNYSRIGDYYTRDRSTPQLDSFYGGRQDLTAALGFERDGQTVILFRRKLNSSDEADHIIGSGPMQVIWARGQEHGKYVHKPASGLEKESASIADFYKPDELKYHGQGDQRGVTVITFIEPLAKVESVKNESHAGGDHQAGPSGDHHQHGSGGRHVHKSNALCGGEWKYPVSCDPFDMDCTYYAKWEYLENIDQIRFTITANHTNRWLAIGFSETASMPQTDVVLGWVDPNGRAFVGDMWAVGYTAPKLDDSQDLINATGRIEDGKTTLTFQRKRITKDKEQDVQFTDDSCFYFKFPVNGGTRNAVNKRIGKHLQTPFISSDRVCIRSCGLGTGKLNGITYTTTPPPPTIAYNIGLKMVGLANDFEVPQMGSPEFNELAERFGRQVENALQAGKVPGVKEAAVTEFLEEEGGLVANMIVVLDKKSTEEFEQSSDLKIETETVVRTALRGAIAGGQVGSIRVDPAYLKFETALDADSLDPLEVSGRGWNSSLTTISLYCVIGCIIMLVIIAIIQASCTIYKVSRKSPSSVNKDQVAVNWRDYSSTNYAYEPFETDEALRAAAVLAANGSNGHTMMTASTTNGLAPRVMQRPPSNGSLQSKMTGDRNNTYSLPHKANMQAMSSGTIGPDHPPNGRPRTHSSTSFHQPDFYFMPSQRRYSGYAD